MSESTSALSLWENISKELKNLLPSEQYHTWFEEGFVCVKEAGNELTLRVSSEFNAIWIEDNYCDIIAQQARSFVGSAISVKVEFDQPVEENARTVSPNKRSIGELRGNITGDLRSGALPPVEQVAAASHTFLNPRNTFENLVVGDGNKLAHAASIAVANTPGRAYNPLFVFGETGLGKTHLMHAVAHQMLVNNPRARIVYTSTEKFTNEFIRAISEKNFPKFHKYYRTVDALLVDDIHFLSGKMRIQEEFFNTFNDLFESGRQIFLTSDRPANEIKGLESRLISRFQWGLVADIEAPDFETCVAILRKKAIAINFVCNDEIIEFLAKHVSCNVRRMEGALTRIASYNSLIDRRLDLDEVESLLNDLLQEEAASQVTIDQIQRKVADYFKIGYNDLIGRRRTNAIVFPRQVAMYISRMLTGDPLKSIGDAFGGRDHGTVIHACKQVENVMGQDVTMKRAVDYLINQLSRNRL